MRRRLSVRRSQQQFSQDFPSGELIASPSLVADVALRRLDTSIAEGFIEISEVCRRVGRPNINCHHMPNA